jgi:hypothetical protein
MEINMIVSFKSLGKRYVRASRVEVGDILWAVRKGHLYWIWCYTSKEMAEQMDKKLGSGPTNEGDRQANWRKSLSQLTPTAIQPLK